jgi:hypothetical protein
MSRAFPSSLKYAGVPIVAASLVLAVRLILEQTIWSWARGPQMVGFSLMHSGLGVILILALYGGLLWAGAVVVASVLARNLGGKLVISLLFAYAFAWRVVATPYGFWQRAFIDKYSPAQAIDFFTYAAASGDLRTVEAFLNHGVDINSQGRNGTALHGAAVEGEPEIIEFLLAHGADVNAVNAYGDSPMANALQAKKRVAETQSLLEKRGGKLIRGSEEQRNRVIEEQVRKDIEAMDRGVVGK